MDIVPWEGLDIVPPGQTQFEPAASVQHQRETGRRARVRTRDLESYVWFQEHDWPDRTKYTGIPKPGTPIIAHTVQ
jgi:hypothetical protein